MRDLMTSGFDLPGGEIGIINGVSIAVQCVVFSQSGLLLVKEKGFINKTKDGVVKTALSFKETRHWLWKMIVRKREAGDFSVDEEILKKEIENARSQQKDSIVLISAIKKILGKTGVLIKPEIIARFDIKSKNAFPEQVVMCSGKIISGKLKTESGGTFNDFLPLSSLPANKIIYLPATLQILLNENFQFPFPKIEVENFLKDKAST